MNYEVQSLTSWWRCWSVRYAFTYYIKGKKPKSV